MAPCPALSPRACPEACPIPAVSRREDTHSCPSSARHRAVISSADTREEMSHRDWFEQWLHLPHGIPSHDAFGQVFVLLDPELLEAGFAHWVQAPHGLAASRVAALDGQTIRCSHHRSHGRSALHTVSAYTSESRPVPAQPAMDAQSNNPTAIPEVPALLNPAMPLSPSMPSAA